MRFSKKQFPILEHLDNAKDLFNYQQKGLTKRIISSSRSMDIFSKLLNSCFLLIDSKNIDYVSVPFMDKILSENIFEKLTDLFHQIEECQGILLYPLRRASRTRAASYIVFPGEKDNVIAEIHLYDQTFGRYAILFVDVDGSTERTNWKGLISEDLKIVEDNKQMDDLIINHLQTVFSVLTFKQFAEIEVTEIGGKDYPKRLKVGKEKYLNEVAHQINVLDSRWYTQTIRSDGFPVSGHFRLQPYGPNMSKKKLIYIDDYLKTGYTRKARIESSENN